MKSIKTVIIKFSSAQDRTQIKQVVVETFTRVGVTEFAKEREVKRKQCTENSDYSTPELAAESQFSCMAAQDFDTWLRGWSPESVDLMKKRYISNWGQITFNF